MASENFNDIYSTRDKSEISKSSIGYFWNGVARLN